MTKGELLKAIGEASAKADAKEISRLAKELVSLEVEERKAEVVKVQAEAEQLAGVRSELETELKVIFDNDRELRAKLGKVKAFGFVYSIDHPQPGDPDTKVIGGLALRTPEIAKAKRTSNGGGIARGTGEFAEATKSTGYTPAKAYEEFATDEDKAKMAKASGASAQWKIREDVRQREIIAGNIKVK